MSDKTILTDEERERDREIQNQLMNEFLASGYEARYVCIFERIEPRYSSERFVRAIVTYSLTLDEEIGGIQVSNPYLETYSQRFTKGLKESNEAYRTIKRIIAGFPTAKLIWEGRMNENAIAS